MKIGHTLILIPLALALFCSDGVAAVAGATLRKVVIDPGHGGRDSGATMGNLKEKNINLAIALRLGALIEKHCPDVQVIYTRKSDVEVDLKNRGAIANKADAGLFISIHTNSSKGAAPSGSETYVMGLDKTGKSLDVAMRENDVIIYEKDYSSRYQGYEPGSPESFIIFNLVQYSYLEQSLSLASLIEKQYQQIVRFPSRGVRQGPFLVLWDPAMPSLLTEVGFINNDSDRKVLSSSEGQDNVARAIFNAFSIYKARVDGRDTPPIALAANDGKVATPEVAVEEAPAAISAEVSPSVPAAEAAIPTAIPAEIPVAEAAVPATEAVGVDNTTITPETIAAPSPSTKPLPPTPSKESGVIFAVQLCASSVKLSPSHPLLKSFGKEIYEYKEDNLYRYYLGRFSSYNEALTLRERVRRTVKDAFVVALRNGRKIPVSEMRQLMGK